MTTDAIKWRFKPSLSELVSLVCGTVLLLWYAWLLDDAYVYYRYVDNLVLHGHGLVWNPGEYVEGFSSPLWTLILIALRALHADFWITTLIIGVFCFIGFWWLACLINRRLMGSSLVFASALNIPLLYLSLTYAVSCYFTSGLETPLVNLLAAVYAAAVLWPRSRTLQILVGLSPMIRPELALPFLLFLIYARYVARRIPWTAVGACAATLIPFLIFRVWYYADFFPNTFHLKDISWPLQGLKYLYDTLLPYQTAPLLLLMAALFFSLRRRGGWCEAQGTERAAMLLIAAPILIYVVKIGGDARHFRYLSFPFILAVLASGGLVEQVFASLRLPRALVVTACALAFVSGYPRQLQHHPLLRRVSFRHADFLSINDAAYHRLNTVGTTPPIQRYNGELSVRAAHERQTREAAACGASIPVIARGGCRQAYLHPVWRYVHGWGLTEGFLARTSMPSDLPAHKYGLFHMARMLAPLRAKYGFGPGVFDRIAAQEPSPPPWIVRNLPALRQIEKKVYNQHRLGENLRLAWQPIPPLQVLDGELPAKLIGNRYYDGPGAGPKNPALDE